MGRRSTSVVCICLALAVVSATYYFFFLPTDTLVFRNGVAYKPNSKRAFSGRYQNYWENGLVMFDLTYSNGFKEGESTFYWANGQVADESYWSNNKRVGQMTWYDNSGNVCLQNYVRLGEESLLKDTLSDPKWQGASVCLWNGGKRIQYPFPLINVSLVSMT